MVAAHHALVTGTKCQAPADMTLSDCWISNTCRIDKQRLYTTMTSAKVKIYTHQIVAACVFGRRAMLGACYDMTLEDAQQKSSLINNVSHLCHNQCCIHPGHLVIEPSANNNARQTCNATGTCAEGIHDEPRCISVRKIPEHIFDQLRLRGSTLYFRQRLREVQELRQIQRPVIQTSAEGIASCQLAVQMIQDGVHTTIDGFNAVVSNLLSTLINEKRMNPIVLPSPPPSPPPTPPPTPPQVGRRLRSRSRSRK
jgi:hypothetical protein